jgi:hypothetical protein
MACGAKTVAAAAKALPLTVQSPEFMRGYAVNDNNTQIDRASALSAAEPARGAFPNEATPAAWRWILVGHLLMLTTFAGMSLVVGSLAVWYEGGAGHGRDALFATALAGLLLGAFGWLGVLRLIRFVDGEPPQSGPGLARLTHREAA